MIGFAKVDNVHAGELWRKGNYLYRNGDVG